MRPRKRTALPFQPGRALATFVAFAWLTFSAHADSFPAFSVLFTQITNDIALIEENFENSPAQRQMLGVLTRARTTILDPGLRDEQILSTAVNLLGGDVNYAAVLDLSAANARAAVLGRYDLLATRVADLPPSPRASEARERFNELAEDRNALANAEHAGRIANLLAPFGRRIENIAELVASAEIMLRPRVRANSVRGRVNDHRFISDGNGRHSPNIFEVTKPTPFYYSVLCRVVDKEQVINFTLPVVTDQVRYEISQGLATLSYTPDVFASNVVTLEATSGTFFVQVTEKEIYGIFSCAGPGLEIQDGRFRVEIPRALRGNN